MSALYRIQQFVRAAGSWIRSGEGGNEFVARYLPPEAARLFEGMSRYDQRHALHVCRTLVQQGHTERGLLAAALLHDVGKSVTQGARVRLWHRVAVVLSQIVSPDLLGRLAKDQQGSWRRPLYVQLHHATIGAEAARLAGCSTTTVSLIRRHEDAHDQTPDPLLAALQAADSQN